MSGAVDALVAHALGARMEDAPPAALAAVKTFTLDTLGVGVAGAAAPMTEAVRQAALGWSGAPQRAWAHFFGPGGAAATPAQAAFVNGFQIHCQEFDCVHEPAVVHPMATVFAALMAESEAAGTVSGRDFAMALAVAVDVAAGLGVAATRPLKFFRPATAGIFGAALGVARLRGFDPDTAKNALGLALGFCSGTMQAHTEGKPALPIQIANAARGAVMACDLAGAGLEAAEDSLEGPYGYFSLFEDGHDLAPVLEALGRSWRIAEVSHKPFPTGRAAQGGIGLMQRLRADGVEPAAVETITLSAPPLIKRLVGRPWRADMSANYARLCFQYCGARALAGGGVGLEDFSEAALRDGDIARLAARIQVVENDVPDPAAFTPQSAVAELSDGRQVEARLDRLPGSPADPLSGAENEAKFRACLDFGFGGAETDRAAQIIEAVGRLEDLEDAGALARLAAGMEGA